ncbi:hypothetical protein BCR39DRAFT_222064 [Naematelia encephala]|uniref:Arrestin-like N-terminal domain-containing protein n=1 Tax=Naematelia encephala TaxID=71784 RepID=A0A1Y2AYF9_9TREE|nr:hypothetical protein BCR39DRAFT_222064 [Naematelia encephala]
MSKPTDPPPYSSTPAQGSGGILSDSSHHIALQIPDQTYHPGSTVQVKLSVPRSDVNTVDGDVACSLEGYSSVGLMGKSRYQAAQIANAGMGAGGAYAVTAHEDHVFARSSNTIPMTLDKSHAEMGGEQVQFENGLVVPTVRTCDCPGPKENGILPSVPETDMPDRSSVVWKVKVVIKRKGLLKRDIHLSVIISMDLPPNPPLQNPLSFTASRPLSFSNNTLSSPPQLTAELVILRPTKPLTIPFRILLSTTPSPSILSIDDIPPRGDLEVSFSLSRHVWTSGIENSKFNDKGGFQWVGTRVGTLGKGTGNTPGRIGLVQGEKGGEKSRGVLEFEGEYEYLPGQKTVQGCGLAITWSAHVHAQWNKMQSPLSINAPIQLPLV